MNSIAKISVQRYVIAGDVMNSVTAYDEKGYKVGREQRIFRSKSLTDDEVRKSVGVVEIPISRETLGPATGRW